MVELPTPRLSEQDVINIAQLTLRQQQWAYDQALGLRARWRGIVPDVPGHEGASFSLWSVMYTTPQGPFDQVDHALGIDDQTGQPLYMMTGTSRYDFL